MDNVVSFEKKTERLQGGIRIIRNPDIDNILKEELCIFDDFGEDELDPDSLAMLNEGREAAARLDETARIAAKEAGIRDAEFMIDGDSIARLANAYDGVCFVKYQGHSTTPGNTAEYSVILSPHDIEEGEIRYIALALKFTGESAFWYNPDTQAWEEDQYLQMIYDMAEHEGGVAKLIHAVEEKSGCCLMLGNSRSAARFLAEVQPLCRLYELVSGLADFQVTSNGTSRTDGSEEYDDLDVSVFLIPDDCFREGCKVGYRQGRFRFLRCFDPHMLYDMHNSWEGNPDALEAPYLAEAFSEPSIKKAAQALRDMWDHYSKDTVFCFPLSDSAYTEYRTYSGELVTVTRNGTRKLTQNETAALREVMDVLQLS